MVDIAGAAVFPPTDSRCTAALARSGHIIDRSATRLLARLMLASDANVKSSHRDPRSLCLLCTLLKPIKKDPLMLIDKTENSV